MLRTDSPSGDHREQHVRFCGPFQKNQLSVPVKCRSREEGSRKKPHLFPPTSIIFLFDFSKNNNNVHYALHTAANLTTVNFIQFFNPT